MLFIQGSDKRGQKTFCLQIAVSNCLYKVVAFLRPWIIALMVKVCYIFSWELCALVLNVWEQLDVEFI